MNDVSSHAVLGVTVLVRFCNIVCYGTWYVCSPARRQHGSMHAAAARMTWIADAKPGRSTFGVSERGDEVHRIACDGRRRERRRPS